MYIPQSAAMLIEEIQKLQYGEFHDLYIPSGPAMCWIDRLKEPFRRLLRVIEEHPEIKCLKFQNGLPTLCEIETETEVGKAIQKIKF